MDREALRAKLKDMLAIVDEDIAKRAKVGDDIEIREGIGLDSLQVVELLFEIEEQIGVKIQDDEAPKIKTVGDLLDLVLKKLAEKQR